MNATSDRKNARRPMLEARTAAELMTANPLSVRESATLAEAVRFLADKGFSAAPVIDERGRPIGVLSRADILIFDCESSGPGNLAGFYGHADLSLPEEVPYPIPA